MPSVIKAMQAHLSINKSSCVRKPANATRQMASKQTSVREGDGPAASTMTSDISAVTGYLHFFGIAIFRLRPLKVACTAWDPAMDGKPPIWCNHETAYTASYTADFD